MTPIEISFHGVQHSDAVEARIREKGDWLHRFFDRMTHLRVVVEHPHKHHSKGSEFAIKIDVGIPGRPNLIVLREANNGNNQQAVIVAVNEAFDAARRQLLDITDKMAGKVKTLRGKS
jgi:ribosome-associated translation inhibitor RaiA